MFQGAWNAAVLWRVSHQGDSLPQAVHPNWCQQVKFISDLNLVVSCSAVEKSSLVLTLLPSKDLDKPK